MAHRVSPDDRAFIQEFEAFGIASDDFDHYAHLRMAYIYLCDYELLDTFDRARNVLCGFLSHLEIDPASKYHETLTQAWILAVRHFMANTPDTNSASELIDVNPLLLDSDAMMNHYTNNVLFSDEARITFVEPNLAPIPGRDDGLQAPETCLRR